jgi:hypothetical protein
MRLVADDPFFPVPYDGPHTEDDLELFGPYRVLYPIVVEGRRCYVPADLSILRACQYLEIKERSVRLPWGKYCWNNTTGCCESLVRLTADAEPTVMRACQTRVRPGLVLEKLPKGGRSCKVT